VKWSINSQNAPQPDFQEQDIRDKDGTIRKKVSIEEQQNVYKQRRQEDLDKQGPFLEGLNVSGLLLDPQLKPVAWAVNTNQINKTQHAETTLVLAWLKGNPNETLFDNYTFISPWRSCCMCSGWIADVFKNCNVIWFIDDPGLPIRHLDPFDKTKEGGGNNNGAGETFLPSKLKGGSAALKTLLQEYPWFEEFGRPTYYDYNNDYLTMLKELVDEPEKAKPGPVGLFKSKKYFTRLTESWDRARSLSPRLVKLLQEKNELNSYVNNVWALRRCIMAFDPAKAHLRQGRSHTGQSANGGNIMRVR
jgi:hypothetical protein